MKRLLTASTIILMTVLSSCQKDDIIEVNSITINKSTLSLLVGYSETLTALVAPDDTTEKSVIWTTSNPTVAQVDQTGLITAVSEGQATITVKAKAGNCEATCSVTVIKATMPHQLWGLGLNLSREHSNNVDYEWYIDQATSGEHRDMNCGPACVTMACKWANPDFTKTAEDARNAFLKPFDGSWGWAHSIVEAYLTDNKIVYSSVNSYNVDEIINILDSGHIGIMSLLMNDVIMATGNPEWRKDRFYPVTPLFAHFILLKGYKIVDEITWFEVYDPYSNDQKYLDGSLKGRNRYYRGTELMNRTAMTIIHKPEIE